MSDLARIPTLPGHIDLRADWPKVEAELETLLEGPEAGSEAAWLEAWSDLSIRVGESVRLAYSERSRDTRDAERKADYLHVVREVTPRIQPIDKQLKQRLLDSGYEAPGLETTLRQFRSDAALFREENVPLMAQVAEKSSEYGETVGSLEVDFEGQPRTLSALQPFQASPDRSTRQAAWQAGQDAYTSVAETLHQLFEALLPLRQQIATNAGFTNFRDYSWQARGRFDYSVDDALRFHEAIRQTFVPALERRAARRAELLGLTALRPWDVDVDPHGSEPLRPFTTGQELAEGSARIFDRVGPVLGQRIRDMQAAGLLDLENRPGKAPGGYCMTLPARGMPFIFMNAVGTDRNLQTMLHEAGHAFHAFEASRLPLIWQRGSPMEFAEVASMAMELLASPYIDQGSGGFYDSVEAIRSRVKHLESMLFFMPYMATVSAFQHRIYTMADPSREARDATWLELHEAYCVGVDWSSHEASRRRLWHQKQHIFGSPFYYIEYGIAQLGALQIWRAAKDDPEAALERYLGALALGGTRSLPELFRAAGAELIWDAEPMAELVQLIEDELASLEARLPAAG